jgi:hypothetical protein
MAARDHRRYRGERLRTSNDGTLWANITATQTDGSVKTYHGTYTVSGGQIVSANIDQTS